MTKLRNRMRFMVGPSRVLISERKEGRLVPLTRPAVVAECVHGWEVYDQTARREDDGQKYHSEAPAKAAMATMKECGG
jgi:hypothetical protein